MAQQADESKVTGKRKKRWSKVALWLLPALLLLAIYYMDCGILPSSDTQQLRHQLRNVTKVKVVPGGNNYWSGQKTFTLHGKDAVSFVNSILLVHPLHKIFERKFQVIGGDDYFCEFYSNQKLILKSWVKPDTGFITWGDRGRVFLYPRSRRYLNRFLIERTGGPVR